MVRTWTAESYIFAEPEQYQRIGTVTLRFSPRLGFSPVNRALANSKAAPAALDGPSHSSAVTGSTRSTRTLGSSGPPGNQRSSVFFQIHDPRHHSRRCGYIRLSRRVARNNDRCKDRAKASPRPMLSAHCPTQRPGARNVDIARKLKLPLSAKPRGFDAPQTSREHPMEWRNALGRTNP